jgi:hypothetical protein
VFGGISMILLGDFQQLDPVAGKSLSDSDLKAGVRYCCFLVVVCFGKSL